MLALGCCGKANGAFMAQTNHPAEAARQGGSDGDPDVAERRILQQLASAIAIVFVSIITAYLAWLALAVGLACDTCYIGNDMPWVAVNTYNANSGLFAKLIAFVSALIAFGAGFVSAKKESRQRLYVIVILGLIGFALAAILMMYGAQGPEGTAWALIGMDQDVYDPDPTEEFGDPKSTLFQSHLTTLFGSLAFWYLTMVGLRIGFRFDDLKKAIGGSA